MNSNTRQTPPTSGVLCAYYMNGACKYGDGCMFSHNMSDAPSMVCRYYLAGHCAYGDKCRYDHIKPDWSSRGKAAATPASAVVTPSWHATANGASASTAQHHYHEQSTSTAAGAQLPNAYANDAYDMSNMAWGLPYNTSDPFLADDEADPWDDDDDHDDDLDFSDRQTATGHPDSSQQAGHLAAYQEAGDCNDIDDSWEVETAPRLVSTSKHHAMEHRLMAHAGHGDTQPHSAWAGGPPAMVDEDGTGTAEDGTDAYDSGVVDPAELPVCSQYFATGSCARGDGCLHIHGDMCEVCHKFAINPYNPDQAQQHRRECALRHKKLVAHLRSTNVECGVCLEKVLSKASPAERRFGLLTCDHAFCLGCIRSWRRTTHGGADVDMAVRACPLCRTLTHFVTPSAVWPATAEEKQAIVEGYKTKLSTVDCRHFNMGNGTCPFGTSCFYRHAYPDGRLEEPSLRKYGNADGQVQVLQPLRLSSYFDTDQAQRAMRRRVRH